MNLHTVCEMGNRVQADDGVMRLIYYALEEMGAPLFLGIEKVSFPGCSFGARGPAGCGSERGLRAPDLLHAETQFRLVFRERLEDSAFRLVGAAVR